ncbi:hypothetical protein RBB50_006636 [Rhinocladiella similis]
MADMNYNAAEAVTASMLDERASLTAAPAQPATTTTASTTTTDTAQACGGEATTGKDAVEHPTPQEDSSQAVESKYISFETAMSATQLRLAQLPIPESFQARAIRIVQSFVEMASRERHARTLNAEYNGRSNRHDVGSNDTGSCSTDEARLIFTVKNRAVLESIKVRGEIKRALEEYCAMRDEEEEDEGEDGEEDGGSETDLTALPSTEHIRLEAQKLLEEFDRDPLPDLADPLAV